MSASKEYLQEYRKSHRENILKYHKRWRDKNKGKMKKLILSLFLLISLFILTGCADTEYIPNGYYTFLPIIINR